MNSKNKPKQTAAEKQHAARVAGLPCVVCDAPAPSEVHEIAQGEWFTSISLCPSCHRDNFNGIHGQARIWKVKKLTELQALGILIGRILYEA